MPPKKKPILLVILDGYGLNRRLMGNAVALADTPHLHAWLKEYPHAFLHASGTFVGLLKGVIGNSEVGHLTIGTGRIIPQPLAVMHDEIKSGRIAKDKILLHAFKKLAKHNGRLHLMGLLSDAGVHSHCEYLYALIKIATEAGIKHIFIHAFLDARDVKPQSAEYYLKKLDQTLKRYQNASIGSLHGRLYAMDRNHNMSRTKRSFNILAQPKSQDFRGWSQILANWYKTGKSEEFLPPVSLDPTSIIKPGDGIISFNFRPDRMRQLTGLLLEEYDKKLSFFITPYAYGADLKTTTLYKKPIIKHTLTDILKAHKKSVFAIAETEKYAHITYFFNAGREKPYGNETWSFIPSLKPKSFINHPTMSAPKITTAILKSLKTDPKDVYIINYANPDMVGHSGNLKAALMSLACIDRQLEKLYKAVVDQMDGTLIVTADHGNAEQMIDAKTGAPLTAHTANRVPFIYIRKELHQKECNLPLTELADIAPFLLNTMGIATPIEMRKRSYSKNLLGFLTKSATQIK